MPHAALWVVQRRSGCKYPHHVIRFNAARGFVGGAAAMLGPLHAARDLVSMPHAALWVVQPPPDFHHHGCARCFNAARGFVGGAANKKGSKSLLTFCFNAARGFVGGAACAAVFATCSRTRFQCRTRLCEWCSLHFVRNLAGSIDVSMPHAALWVVQPHAEWSAA